MKKALRGCQ